MFLFLALCSLCHVLEQFMQIIWWSITFCSAFELKSGFYIFQLVIKQRSANTHAHTHSRTHSRLSLRAPFGLLFSIFYGRCNKLLRICCGTAQFLSLRLSAGVSQFYALYTGRNTLILIDTKNSNTKIACQHLLRLKTHSKRAQNARPIARGELKSEKWTILY